MSTFNPDDFIDQLSIDCVIFGYCNKELKVLISKLTYGEDLWSLPGGYIRQTESTDQAASRVLADRTGITQIFLQQFHVFGAKDRIAKSRHREVVKSGLKSLDPIRFNEQVVDWVTGRFVSIGYYALVDINKVSLSPGKLESELAWKGIRDLPDMTHDHNEIVTYALETLRHNLDRKLIGFNLLPEKFTMNEVKGLYEAVYDRSFPMNNFQKKILDLKVLERIGKKYTGAANRAPYLYRFKSNRSLS